LARSYTAGMSFLRDRSPVTPKMIRLLGPAMRLSRRSEDNRSGLNSGVISTGDIRLLEFCRCEVRASGYSAEERVQRSDVLRRVRHREGEDGPTVLREH